MNLLHARHPALRWRRHLKRRTTAARKGKKLPVDVALLGMAYADLNQRGAARTRGELECCATSPETANSSASALASHAAAGLVLEAAAGTSHYGHAPKMRSRPPV